MIDADDMQAFIDGIKEKSTTLPLTRQDAMAMALGRCTTVMMESVNELALMAADEKSTDIDRINAGLLCSTYAALVETLRDDLGIIMRQERRIIRVG